MARELAVQGNARHSGPRSVPLGNVVMTQEPVKLAFPGKVLMINQGVDSQLPLCQGLIWHGALVMDAE